MKNKGLPLRLWAAALFGILSLLPLAACADQQSVARTQELLAEVDPLPQCPNGIVG